MDFTKAVDAHVAWKLKLQTAIRNNETLDATTIYKDDQCEIGKWIHGEGATHAGSDAYELLKKEHAHFHTCAGDVVAKINAGDADSALHMLDAGSAFTGASTETVSAIIKMRKELGQEAA